MSEALCPKCGEHCYAKLLNSGGDKVFDEERFCTECKAHLAPSGICLNACGLRKFRNLMAALDQEGAE